MDPMPAARPQPGARPGPVSREELGAWLTELVAAYAELPPGRIDPGRPLADYGLDSVYALAVCSDIEDRFGLAVEPTLAWDHPTVEAIARHLYAELARS
ncbi:hypothetical protein GCM10023085_31640 [Actinomadura viridis]|uniref:Acyl carrier protein n=1 Tax=Actinomadura viridis TaxID=58110 RepID=A0A931DG32_9ACTN|nr:acyl carrier protein [Actinomadura viridis]MBG6086846.1 acyl carrier protein [Actinomadura viridis]